VADATLSEDALAFGQGLQALIRIIRDHGQRAERHRSREGDARVPGHRDSHFGASQRFLASSLDGMQLGQEDQSHRFEAPRAHGSSEIETSVGVADGLAGPPHIV
jgi:hypothetical protein